jgi:hypothetical protein
MTAWLAIETTNRVFYRISFTSQKPRLDVSWSTGIFETSREHTLRPGMDGLGFPNPLLLWTVN